jgi:hypothetical protein
MITKTLLLTINLLIALLNLQAQTNVSGVISSNTIWTIGNSPYIVTGNILVEPGVTLTIEPGVTVKFDNVFYLKIQGEIIAIGSSQNRIHFTAYNVPQDSSDYWEYIWLTGTTVNYDANRNYINGTIFKNCVIEFAEYGLFIDNASFYIDSCELRNNTNGIVFKSVVNSIIINCNIHNNDNGTSTYYQDFVSDKFANVQFVNNDIYDNNYIGLRFNTWQLNSYNNLITDNYIRNNGTWGMFIGYSNISSGIKNSIITNNIIYNNTEGGIFLVGNHNTISNNIISNNEYGISTEYADTNVNIYNNVLIENETGVIMKELNYAEGRIDSNHFYSNSKAIEITDEELHNYSIMHNTFLNNSSVLIEIEIGDNLSIHNNNFFSKSLILNNLSSSDIQAENNYWYETDINSIALKIYDYFDNFELGQVIYEPILVIPDTETPISSPINVYKGASGNDVAVYWNSNLESDLSGYKIYYHPIDKFLYANSIDVGNDTSYVINGLEISDTIVVTAYDAEADGIDDLFEGHESWYSQPAQTYFISDLLSGNAYCRGDVIEYQITANIDFQVNNEFIIQLSDTSGSFDNPVELISIDTSSSVFISTSFPDTLTTSKQFLMRVKSTNPEAYSSFDTVIFYQIPTSTFVMDTNILCNTDTVLISYTGTGSFNASYYWSFSGGNIISGTGQGDYQINWNTSGLKNISLLVSENGCTSSLSSDIIKVFQPNSNFSLEEVVCNNMNTIIYFNGNASDSATFNWDFNSANVISGSGAGPYTLNWDDLGTKNVSLSINDNGCYSPQTTKTIEHNPIPTPTIIAPSSICFAAIANINYIGTASDAADFNWNFSNGTVISGTGAGPFEITWDSQGIKTVSLNVSENGCSSDTSVVVSVNQQTQPVPICMVSVDTSNHNMVVWEQLIDNPYDSILIYKETPQSDVYEKIGSQSANDISVFIDSLSNPLQSSSRYKIAVLDTCGFETTKSNYHKTIHLTINSGIGGAWNLIWDGYEGFNYSTYNIYRGTSDDNLLKIAEQASNTFTYSDIIPPVGTVYYQIEVVNPHACEISNLKSSNDYYSYTRSNVVNSSQVSSLNDLSLDAVKIWPNPADNKFYIKLDKIGDTNQILVMSFDGKVLINKGINVLNTEIDISALNSGIYMIMVITDNKTINKKFIKL